MKVNIDKINKIIGVLILIIIVAAGLSCIWLNKFQQIIVVVGAVVMILNLLLSRHFFNKNGGSKRK